MIGELLDHYRVLELVGRGAMGVVYKGLDVNLDRTVAIKVMSAEARNDPDFVERFRQEARMQGALNHPNIAMLFDYFVHDGAPVAVMEYIDGESLEQMIRRRGPIPARECIPLFKQALQGVAAAHRAGIVHRDLKPANLMLTRDSVVKVMDFGIAKRQGVTGATKVSSTSIGSPLYMAPEQILGRSVDCRTDIYALGIVLYELLAGQRPFNTRGKAEYLVLDAHVNELPEPPTVYRYGIPQPLVDAVMRALAKDPDARFQTADEFMRALPDVGALGAAAPAVDMPVDVPLEPEPQLPAVLAGPTGTVAIRPGGPAPRLGPTGTLALQPDTAAPRLGPTGTMALKPDPAAPRAGSSGTVALKPDTAAPRRGPTGTVALSAAPPSSLPASAPPVAARESSATVVFEPTLTKRFDPSQSIAVDFSAGTVWEQLHPPAPAPAAAAEVAPSPASSAAARPAGRTPAPRKPGVPLGATATLAAFLAALALGALLLHGVRLRVPAAAVADTQGPPAPDVAPPVSNESSPPESPAVSPDPVVSPPPPAEMAATTSASAPGPAAATTAPARQDLAGSWRGEYLDASGKSLLRVVNLSISAVRKDGGIEGTLEYQAATGNGECKLHPRGSNWSAPERRLQLSPEGCSPHFPRELGVPLDFADVNPRANTLKDGRIEAPTGELIRVRLKRVSGV